MRKQNFFLKTNYIQFFNLMCNVGCCSPDLSQTWLSLEMLGLHPLQQSLNSATMLNEYQSIPPSWLYTVNKNVEPLGMGNFCYVISWGLILAAESINPGWSSRCILSNARPTAALPLPFQTSPMCFCLLLISIFLKQYFTFSMLIALHLFANSSLGEWNIFLYQYFSNFLCFHAHWTFFWETSLFRNIQPFHIAKHSKKCFRSHVHFAWCAGQAWECTPKYTTAQNWERCLSGELVCYFWTWN